LLCLIFKDQFTNKEKSEEMIPKFDKSDNLPKGIHKATLKETKEIFGIVEIIINDKK